MIRRTSAAIKRSLQVLSLAAPIAVLSGTLVAEELGYPEKEELRFGFIKLTDMAPIAIA